MLLNRMIMLAIVAVSSSLKITMEEHKGLTEDVTRLVGMKCRPGKAAFDMGVCVLQQARLIDLKSEIAWRIGESLTKLHEKRRVPDMQTAKIKHLFESNEYGREYMELNAIHRPGQKRNSTIGRVDVEQSPMHLVRDAMRTFIDEEDVHKEAETVLLSFAIKTEHLPIKASIKYRIQVYKYISPTEIDMIPVVSHSGQWSSKRRSFEEIPITGLMREWMDDPSSNYGILVKMVVDGVKEDLVIRDMSGNKKMRVKVFFPLADAPVSEETKRNATDCRQPLKLSFADDFGWDWVLAPMTFDVGYCIPGRSRTMRDMTLVWLNGNGKIKVQTIPKAIVEACHCT